MNLKSSTPLPPYCLPVLDRPWSDIPALIREEAPHYAAFELWLDRLPGFDPDSWRSIANSSPRPLIALFGRSHGRERERATAFGESETRSILEALGPEDWIDLDVRTQADLWPTLETLPKAGPRRIASAHDFEKTPDEVELDAVEKSLRGCQCDVVKISTYCQTEADAVRLLDRRLRWTANGGDPRPSIVFGMGAAGRATRIFGPLWGNALIYAPVTAGSESAPGQIARAQLVRIYEQLGEEPAVSQLFTPR